ncbi:hypothetical protein KY366_06720 [Candidatus Woesearchaeota archaeon]|nr:hypothetical protein [Candidatus Woesearchaeota archaeon]
MGNKGLEMSAMFLIVLVVTIPIYSSFVFAYLSNGYITGEDNVKGYYKKGEEIYININARIDGDDNIEPSQLHLVDSSGDKFTECVKKDDGSFDCSVKIGPGNTHYDNNFKGKDEHQITVVLYGDDYDSNNNNKWTVKLSGAFDVEEPEVKSFTINPDTVNGGEVNLEYEVKDYAYEGAGNKCGGIKEIKVFYGEKEVYDDDTFYPAPDLCTHSNKASIPVSDIADDDGLIEVVLMAYDALGHEDSETASFVYDREAPSSDELKIIDNNGKEVEHAKDEQITVDIIFTVNSGTSDDLDTGNVYADISGINPVYTAKEKAECETKNGGYECVIKDKKMKLAKPGEGEDASVSVVVEAADKAGNYEAMTLTKTIGYDDAGPSATDIRTDKVKGSVSYAGEATTFIAEIDETGAGIDKGDVTLDLSSINGKKEKADECVESGGSWTCYWNGVKAGQGVIDGKKTVSLSGSDLLGNSITPEDAEVVLDRIKPKVVSSDAKGLGVGAEAIEGYIKTSDQVVITAKVREKNGIARAVADFGMVSTTSVVVDGTIAPDEEEGVYTVTFKSDPIDVKGYIDTKIPLNLTDAAGNNYTYQQPIVVHNYADLEHPNYWTHEISCSPTKADRQITSLVEYAVLCSVKLIPLTTNLETISIDMDRASCKENVEGSDSYIKSMKPTNKERGSTEPYIDIKLAQAEMRIDKISMNCSLEIMTREGNNITKNPEIENVTVEIGLYNMPLGELDKATEQKIRDVEDTIAVGWEFIGSLKEVLNYAENICSIIGLLQKVQVFFGMLEQIPLIKEGVGGASSFIEKYATGQTTAFYSACKYVSCDKTLWGNWYTGQKSLWADEIRTAGRGFAAGGDKEVGWYEQMLRSSDFGTMFPETPKDSIILSVFTGCIPGMIYNIEKRRQIQCNYGVCLWDSAENNIPARTCSKQRLYLECKFLLGEALQFVPLNWLRTIMQQVTYILSDPFSLVFGIGGYILCPELPREKHGQCAVLKGLKVIPEIISDFKMLAEKENWKIQGDMCGEYFDRLDKMEEEVSG